MRTILCNVCHLLLDKTFSVFPPLDIILQIRPSLLKQFSNGNNFDCIFEHLKIRYEKNKLKENDNLYI